MDNPFADLIPRQQSEAAPQQAQSNPFADLIPEKAAPVARGTSAPQEKLSPFMSAVTGFNTGVERLAHGALQPLTESGVLGDRVSQASKNVAANREANFKIAEEANPLTANVAQFVGNVAPTMLVPGGAFANLGRAAATGAGIGAAQYVDPGQSRLGNAAWGAGGGALGYGLGKGADAAMRYGNKIYAQSAIPGMVERATEKVKGYITPEQAAKSLQGNYNKAAGANTANWSRVTGLSDVLDAELTAQGKAFNTAPFADKLSEFYQSTAKMEPAVRAKYEQALGFAKHIEEQAPQSFTGAVALRQNLNQELKKYLEKNNVKATDAETTKLIKQLKDGLQDTVKANSGNVDKATLGQFESAWNQANKSHTGLQDYFKSPTTEGILKPVRQRREALQNNALDRAALGKYLRPSLGSNVGINQLNKLTGSDDAARSYIMRNAMEGRGNPNAALAAYEKLSVPQRQALFARRPEGEQLKAANYARSRLGNSPERNPWVGVGHHIAAFGVPGTATGLGAMALGASPEDAFKYGAIAGLGSSGLKELPALLAKKASPASVMRATDRAMTPNKKAGRYLSPVLANLFANVEAE
jgi:hypothetical protein